MAKRQKFTGILQFSDQAALEAAMNVVQEEAPEAEAYGLQDCFYAPGIMKLNMDVRGPESSWEEVKEAVAILAENAVRGYVYVSLEDEEKELFNAASDFAAGKPSEQNPSLAVSEDYFPLEGPTTFQFQVEGPKGSGKVLRKIHKNAEGGYSIQDDNTDILPGDDCWSGHTYFKTGDSLYVSGNGEGPYAYQLVYSGQGQQGDVSAVFNNQSKTTQLFSRLGTQTLELPYGTLEDCLKIRVDKCYINERESREKTLYQYFAKGLGLVKVEFPEGGLELISAE